MSSQRQDECQVCLTIQWTSKVVAEIQVEINIAFATISCRDIPYGVIQTASIQGERVGLFVRMHAHWEHLKKESCLVDLKRAGSNAT